MARHIRFIGTRRGAPAYRGLDPRLSRLASALATGGGRLSSVCAALEVTTGGLRRHFQKLRKLGVLRTIAIFDPRGRGLEIECLTLVRLRRQDVEAIEAFEARCLAEPWVTSAVKLSGRFDYQMVSWHRDSREVARWRRVLESDPDLASVSVRSIQTIKGNHLAGAVIIDDR